MTISTHKFNVLVVEDNEGDFILIEDYLKEKMNNPFVQQAKSFAGATGVLDKNKQFDVILLDLSLPDISGEELVKKISKLAEQIPIIVLTGYAQKNFGVKTLSLGVSDYLLKDEFTPTELYKSIIYSIERKRINSKLKESEQKYRHIFHSSPLPMWVYEIDTLRFLDVNNAAVRHYGYSQKDFLSMTIKDIRPPEDIKQLKKVVSLSEGKGELYFQGIFRHKKKSGEIIMVDIQSNIISFDGRHAELVLATDITEKLKAEQQLKKSEAALRKLNRELEKRVAERTTELMESNEELEMFNYAVSHELRAPLRFMNFCLVSIIKMRDKNQLEEAFEVIEDMLNASNKMYQQLEDLLAFSKVGKQTIKHEKFDMYQLLKEVLKDLGREYDLAKYTIEITPQPLVFGDKNLLYYLLRNLLSNALKYSSKKEKPHIEIDVEEKKQEFIYSIKDNGVGFNMKYYHALFKYFERLHSENEFAGNGAGLSIAQRIIKRHGGEIWAEGKEGKGACFYFSLPKKAPRSKF